MAAQPMRKTFPLTPRQAARAGPRDEKPRGSEAWCWQTLDVLKICYERLESNWRQVEAYLQDLEGVAAWRLIPPERPYGSLEALLQAELGCSEVQFRHELRQVRAAEAKRLAANPAVTKADTHAEAGAKGGRGKKAPDNIMGFGTSASYLVRRLKRDAPAIAERLAHGEFPSARAAAIAAGIPVPHYLQVSATDVDRAVAKLIAHFGLEPVRKAVVRSEVPDA
jgi:hypothetical protein